ncbi:MAG: polysaccharide biosynthesis/export family protein [Chitinophagaceae bacterium]
MQYVQGAYDTALVSQYKIREPVIQTADLISIIVFSDSKLASDLYNVPNTGASGTGYLVDERGNIQFQGVGTLHVEGLTKLQLSNLLDTKLNAVLTNPYYNIRFLNYKVTLIGELNREGIYTIPNERVNIFEAIGLAGGLGVYARKENVLVIRESNGRRETARLDLTSPQIFKSPYYFLQQNDMVLVEQTKAKSANSDQTTARNISIGTSIISTLIFIYTVFR